MIAVDRYVHLFMKFLKGNINYEYYSSMADKSFEELNFSERLWISDKTKRILTIIGSNTLASLTNDAMKVRQLAKAGRESREIITAKILRELEFLRSGEDIESVLSNIFILCMMYGEDLETTTVLKLRSMKIKLDKGGAEGLDEAMDRVHHSSHFKSLIEKIAAHQHRQWSGWVIWMLDVYNKTDGDGVPYVDRWRRQIATPYKDLSEKEKESDRKEAESVLENIGSYPFGLIEKEALESSKHMLNVLKDQYEERGSSSSVSRRASLFISDMAQSIYLLEHDPTKDDIKLIGKHVARIFAMCAAICEVHGLNLESEIGKMVLLDNSYSWKSKLVESVKDEQVSDSK